jgi:hypothetical protein
MKSNKLNTQTNNLFDIYFKSILLFNNETCKRENEIKVEEKIVNLPFFQSPKKEDNKSSINLLKDKYGIESESCKTLKTPIITNEPTYYNKGFYFLSTDDELINLNIVYDGVNEIICNWNIDLLYKSFKKKNYKSELKKEDLINKINNSELGVKFNVSRLKDHGTLWKFIDRK